MTKYALCAVLLLVVPASATISYVRSNANWSGGTANCQVGLSTTNLNDLIVVWAEWQTSAANTVTVTTTQDGNRNALYNAAGPTVQPTGNIAAQIFYVKSIQQTSDSVTLTFSGTVASSACVMAEFSGADLNYPLDSVSAGYSTASNPANLLDSGTVAPANANLMVFAAGFADTNAALTAGSGFTSQQASNGTWGTGIVENSTTAISGNTVLQRATACFGSGSICSSTTGDWLMQMAVFRDASWTVAGGWSPTRPPDEVNAAQYPGSDICVQAANAGAANPFATILMVINGTQTCSVDPRGGWISGFYNNGNVGGAPQGPSFTGNIKLVGVAGTNPTLAIDVPWLIGGGPNTHNSWTDVGGVRIQASNNFRKNISGPRCFTASSSMQDTTGDEATCSNLALIGSSKQVAIQAGQGSTGNCAIVSLITSQGQAVLQNGGAGDPQVFRANQIVDIMNAADARNDGIYRMVPSSDRNPCGNISSNPPAYNQFWIYAPSAVSCSGSSCGSSILIVAESPMFYMSLRDFDMPTATASNYNTTGKAGIGIDGTELDTDMVSQGNKLMNLGEVDGIGYGIVALDNHFGQEQTWVNTIKSRAIMRTSMMTFGTALAGPGSQNTEGFSHWEDYCGNQDPTDCYSDGTHLPFGLYHVGVWLRDGWGHFGIEDVTFNGPSYAGVMLDGMTGFTSGWTLKDIHFQNTRAVQNVAPPGTSTQYTGGGLCDIAIGFQSAAASVFIEQVEANALQGVLANVCIGGTNHLPVGALPGWSTNYMSFGGMFIPSTNPGCSGSNCIMEVVAPVVGGVAACQPWAGGCGTGTCSTPGATCSDGTLTYENIGANYPNDTGPSLSNQVKIVNLTTQNIFGPAIFNSPTGHSWTDQSIADYTYQNDSSSVYECASSSEHACRVDQGITINGNTVLAGSSTITINPGATACTLASSCSIPLSAVNPQSSAYQVTTADFSNYKTITVGGVATFTITLVASTSQPPNGQHIHIINYGSGTISIARSGQMINGGMSSLILAAGTATAPSSADIISDGTNYFAYLAH